MADASDVGKALVALIDATVYPNGDASPSVINAGIKIYRGWPIPKSLQADLAAGVVNISVFAPPGLEKNTTRYNRDEQVVAPPVHTLTATVAGNTITIAGTVAIPQNVIALCGDAFAFSYQVQASDSLASIAAGLAALIAAQFPGTTSSGPTVTVSGKPGILQARTSSAATVWTEQGRQEKVFWITLWCPTPAIRDRLAPIVDVALRQLDRITLADQSSARMIYVRSNESDEGEKNDIYRRDLVYSIEYPTSTTEQAYEVGAVGVAANGSPARWS